MFIDIDKVTPPATKYSLNLKQPPSMKLPPVSLTSKNNTQQAATTNMRKAKKVYVYQRRGQ